MTDSKISWLRPPSKLKLSTNDVHVWRVRLNQTDWRVQQLQQILSDDERLRAERFHFDRDRMRFIVSQGMLRLIIGDYKEAIFVLPTGSIRKKISRFLKRFSPFGKIINITCLPSNPPE